MKRGANSIVVALLLTTLLAACHNRDVLHRGYANIPASGWEQQDTLLFASLLPDDSKQATLEVWCRNNHSYPYQNLWLFISIEGSTGVIHTDTVELQLADDYGGWLGKGSGTQFQTTYRYLEPISLQGDSLRIGVVHGMRDETLRGITDVGISLYK